MRLLADENFPKLLVESLRAEGHDVVWARTEFPGYNDRFLLEFAENDGRVILTLDKDFWQLAVQRRPALRNCGVVLFRVHPATLENLEPLVRIFVQVQVEWTAHVSILTPQGLQILGMGSA